MYRFSSWLLLAVLAMTLTSPEPSLADACKPLTRIASLDTTDLKDGRITVPANMNGTDFPMLVDTGSPISMIDDGFSQSIGLGRYRIFENAFVIQGESVAYTAMVKNMSLGGVRVEARQLLVSPSALSKDGSVLGLLGADILGSYDTEIDFANHKLNLLRSDHCPGVIYWKASVAGVVPFRVARGGYALVDIALDGKPFQAMVDTGSTDSFISDVAAKTAFGLTPESPDMQKERGVYWHRFKTLDLGGLGLANVPVVVFRDTSNERMKDTLPTGSRISPANAENGVVQLFIGMHELRQFHLYFAYGEGKLYATSAGSSSASAATATHGATN